MEEDGIEQRIREYLVLLLLGTSKSSVHTIVQIQKEFFYLWNSSDRIRSLIRFIPHYRGPFSEALNDSIKKPMYLQDIWEYVPPHERDILSGGQVRLTEKGKRMFNEYMRKIKSSNKMELIELIAAMRLLHDLYDDLTPEELLYFVYVNPENRDFIKRSQVYDMVMRDEIKYGIRKKIEPYFLEPGER